MEKKAIVPKNGAPANRPYSPAIVCGDLIFLSGQIPQDPATGNLLRGDIKEQTRRALENMAGLLAEAGSGLSRVVKVTAFLADMDDYAAFNEVYKEFFGEVPPARTCVQAARLPFDVKVEIDAIALKG